MQRMKTPTEKLQDYYNERIAQGSQALDSHIASIHMLVLKNEICTRLNAVFRGENYSLASDVMRQIDGNPVLVQRLLAEIAQALAAYNLYKNSEESFVGFASLQLKRLNPEAPVSTAKPVLSVSPASSYSSAPGRAAAAANPRSFSNTLASFFCWTGCDENDLEKNRLLPAEYRYYTFKH